MSPINYLDLFALRDSAEKAYGPGYPMPEYDYMQCPGWAEWQSYNFSNRARYNLSLAYYCTDRLSFWAYFYGGVDCDFEVYVQLYGKGYAAWPSKVTEGQHLLANTAIALVAERGCLSILSDFTQLGR